MAPRWWCARWGLEPWRLGRNMPNMENDPFGGPRRPPVLDMTLDGQFRAPPQPGPQPPRGWLDRALGKVGGLALLLALGAGGLLLASLAIVAIGVLLPVVLVAGLVGAGALWWKLRRAGFRMQGGGPGGRRMRFVVVRR